MFKLIFTPLLTLLAIVMAGVGIFKNMPGSFLMWGYVVVCLIFAISLPFDLKRSYWRWKEMKTPTQESGT